MARAYHLIIDGLAAFAALTLAAMVVVIVADVMARNLGFVPPSATVALTEYALLYFTMAAAPRLTRDKGHVSVRVVLDRLSPARRKKVGRLIALLCALICFVMTSVAGALLVESVMLGDIEPRSIDVPRWLLFLPLVVGFFFSGTEFTRFAWNGEEFWGAADSVERL